MRLPLLPTLTLLALRRFMLKNDPLVPMPMVAPMPTSTAAVALPIVEVVEPFQVAAVDLEARPTSPRMLDVVAASSREVASPAPALALSPQRGAAKARLC